MLFILDPVRRLDSIKERTQTICGCILCVTCLTQLYQFYICFYMYTQGFLCLFYWNDFQYCLMQHADQIVQQECVGAVV